MALHAARIEQARRPGQAEPAATLLYGAVDAPDRVGLKAGVMGLGDKRHCVESALAEPTARYRDCNCARGQDANCIQTVKNPLASDRTSGSAWPAPFGAFVTTNGNIPPQGLHSPAQTPTLVWASVRRRRTLLTHPRTPNSGRCLPVAASADRIAGPFGA